MAEWDGVQTEEDDEVAFQVSRRPSPRPPPKDDAEIKGPDAETEPPAKITQTAPASYKRAASVTFTEK